MCHPISILKTQNRSCIESPDTIKGNIFFLFITRLPSETCHCYVVFPRVTKAILCSSSGQKLTFKTKPVVCLLKGLTAEGLQQKLDILEGFCNDWCLKVNTNKTKSIIFNSPGRHLKVPFRFNGKEIECVTRYRYLGLVFSASGTLNFAKQDCFNKAKKAYFKLRKDFLSFCPSIKTSLNVFDHTIQPILLYGSELWGTFNPLSAKIKRHPDLSFDQIYNNLECESLHMKLCKYILGVNQKSTNFAVRSELGRFPIHLTIIKNILLYWHRLENLQEEFPLLKEAFNVSKSLHYMRHNSWFSTVEFILSRLQINSTNSLNKSKTQFKSYIKEALTTFYVNDWNINRLASRDGKLSTYTDFKTNFGFEPYLKIVNNYYGRSSLTKFRISAHRLKIETGRYERKPREERICQRCNNNQIEDEIHFLLACPNYTEARSNLTSFCEKNYKNFNKLDIINKFKWLITNEDPQILTLLTTFLRSYLP